jgi:hypothetical protein
MMLYLLTVITTVPNWDYYDSMIIRARSHKEARKIANTYANREGKIWEDKEKVSCNKIDLEGKSGMILGSFNSAG